MELSHDWVGFQSLFQPKPKGAVGGSSGRGPVYLVVEGDSVITAFAEQEDLSEWIGGSYRELAAQIRHRPVFAFEREQVDRLLQDAPSAGPAHGPSAPVGHAQFYDQVNMLRSNAKPAAPAAEHGGDRKLEASVHFLLEAIHGWWAKLLPASYGIYLRIEGRTERHFILVFRRGTFEGFHEPDLSSIGPERRRQPLEVVRYLSERYLVPVQGIHVPASEWEEWSMLRDPWGLVAKSLRGGRTKLYPRRKRMGALLAARFWFGF